MSARRWPAAGGPTLARHGRPRTDAAAPEREIEIERACKKEETFFGPVRARHVELAPLRGGALAEVRGRGPQPERVLRGAPGGSLSDRGGRPAREPQAGARRPDPRHPDPGAEGAGAAAQHSG